MKYTAKQLMPKRYPDEKPREVDVYWYHDINYDGWAHLLYNNGKWGAGYNADWFIDVPGAPPELKPLAYPEYKPSKTGIYIVYYQAIDLWDTVYWDNFSWQWYMGSDPNLNLKVFNVDCVDYFIPYRLDEENEIENETLEEYRERLIKATEKAYKALYDLAVDVVTAISEQLDGVIEPEIAPCPVCGSEKIYPVVQTIIFEDNIKGDYTRYQCEICGVTTEGCLNDNDARNLWNCLGEK